MSRHWVVCAVLGGFWAAPLAAAEPKFTPPPGCTLTVTVQLRSCQVSNYYSCAGDAPGDQWISHADGEGEYFLSHIDAETRWIESIDLRGGVVEKLDAAASVDNASFSALRETGRDDYDFVTRTDTGFEQRFQGYDQLTGETTVIDGVELERCDFALTSTDAQGNFLSSRKGRQWVSHKLRLFFSDTETYDNSYGDTATTTDTPVTFAFPGESGFAAARPEYDCDMMMTDLSPLLDHPSKEALR